MTAFYNEHDPIAAAWLRELIREGHIAPGVVDERNIQQLREVDFGGFTQVHLFAGIGGWSHALRLAGWPDSRPVWTGSCPCQPFSSAGKQKGAKDARHLWPWMRHLLFRWRPAIAFGEQVASGLGRQWLAGVRANLETLGYAVGAADLCAAGVAAPQIGQRLYWVAETVRIRCPRFVGGKEGREWGDRNSDPASGRGAEDAWASYRVVQLGRDTRRIPSEPEFFPLAHGVSGRVGKLRGYGNAICPQAAAAFVGAYIELNQPSEKGISC